MSSSGGGGNAGSGGGGDNASSSASTSTASSLTRKAAKALTPSSRLRQIRRIGGGGSSSSAPAAAAPPPPNLTATTSKSSDSSVFLQQQHTTTTPKTTPTLTNRKSITSATPNAATMGVDIPPSTPIASTSADAAIRAVDPVGLVVSTPPPPSTPTIGKEAPSAPPIPSPSKFAAGAGTPAAGMGGASTGTSIDSGLVLAESLSDGYVTPNDFYCDASSTPRTSSLIICSSPPKATHSIDSGGGSSVATGLTTLYNDHNAAEQQAYIDYVLSDHDPDEQQQSQTRRRQQQQHQQQQTGVHIGVGGSAMTSMDTTGEARAVGAIGVDPSSPPAEARQVGVRATTLGVGTSPPSSPPPPALPLNPATPPPSVAILVGDNKGEISPPKHVTLITTPPEHRHARPIQGKPQPAVSEEEGFTADDEGGGGGGPRGQKAPRTPSDTTRHKIMKTGLSPLLTAPFTTPRQRRSSKRPKDKDSDAAAAAAAAASDASGATAAGAASSNKEEVGTRTPGRRKKGSLRSSKKGSKLVASTGGLLHEQEEGEGLEEQQQHVPMATPETATRRRADSSTTTNLLRYMRLWGTTSSTSAQGGPDATAGAAPKSTSSVSAADLMDDNSAPMTQRELDTVLASEGHMNDLSERRIRRNNDGEDEDDEDEEEIGEGEVEYDEEDEDGEDVDVSDDSWDDTMYADTIGAGGGAPEGGGGMEYYGSYVYECQKLDWSELPPIPNRFCLSATTSSPHAAGTDMYAQTGGLGDTSLSNSLGLPMAPPYLDAVMLPDQGTTLLERESKRFAVEQGMLLQAVLQLLAERDQVGVEGSIHSEANIWKKGPLKKLSFGGGRLKRPGTSAKWRVKYVELRQGNLCYYDDAGKDRKTIHLRQADTVVQESAPNKNNPGFCFEVHVMGAPALFWMASSEEERQSWMKAIRKAIIGDDGPQKELDLTPHSEALEVYNTIRAKIQEAASREAYIEAIQSSIQTQDDDTLQVPAEWIRSQTKQAEYDDRPALTKSSSKRNITPRRQLKTSIIEFWRQLSQTSFSINGVTVPRDTPLASSRIYGALTRCILEYDKAYGRNAEEGSTTAGQMTELQAVSYARSILLAILRSKEEQPACLAVNHLLRNSDLVVISSKDDEELVVNMEVSFAGEELPDEFLPPISDDLSGWLWIRRSKQPAKMNRRRYVVLSGAALTYYEAANPRPVGLRGQLMLRGATLSQRREEVDGEERFILHIVTPQTSDRILSFENESDLQEWKEAIEAAIESCVDDAETAEAAADADAAAGDAPNPPIAMAVTAEGRPRGPIRRSAELAQGVAESVIKSADSTVRGGVRVIKGAGGGGVKAIKAAKDGSMKVSMKVLRGAGDGSMKVVRAVAGDGGVKVIRTATEGSMKVVRGAVGRLRPGRNSPGNEFNHGGRFMPRRPSMHVLLNNTALSGKRDEPTVQCIFQATNNFWVSAKTDPAAAGGAGEERWLSVSAKLYQAFLLVGGPSGRIARGDALIEIDFGDTDLGEDIFTF